MERRTTGTLALLLMLGAGAGSHVQAPAPAQVKCIDHDQLLDEPTVRIMAAKGVWWSLQPFTDDGSSVYPEGSLNRAKQQQMFSGTDHAYALAKKYRIRTAWGTDILFSPENALKRGQDALQNGSLVHPGRGAQNGDGGQRRLAGLVRAAQPVRGQT